MSRFFFFSSLKFSLCLFDLTNNFIQQVIKWLYLEMWLPISLILKERGLLKKLKISSWTSVHRPNGFQRFKLPCDSPPTPPKWETNIFFLLYMLLSVLWLPTHKSRITNYLLKCMFVIALTSLVKSYKLF